MPHKNSNPVRCVMIATAIDGSAPGFLYLLRSENDGLWPSRLNMPSGHVEVNRETPFEAALREFKEETGTEAKPKEMKLASIFTKTFDVGSGRLENMSITLYAVEKLSMKLDDVKLCADHSACYKIEPWKLEEYSKGRLARLNSGHVLTPPDSVVVSVLLDRIKNKMPKIAWRAEAAAARFA